MCIHEKRAAAATADSNATVNDQVEMAPHHCRMAPAAAGMTDTTEPAASITGITASTTTPRGKEHSATEIATASASSCDAVVVDDKRTLTMDASADPCFPACLGDDQVDNNQPPRVTMASDVIIAEEKATTSIGRRSRRNSRQMSADNQHTHDKSSPLDLEDAAAHHVLATVDYRTVPAPPASIVVDYDEGMPERSRTALLLADGGHTQRPDCAPEACNPLDLLAFEELSIGEVDKDTTTRIRPRLGSATGTMPKTPSSRRGKSVILSATPVPIQEPAPVKRVEPKQSLVTDEDTTEAKPERCSTAHKLCLCEVGLHKSQESCWLVANGSVYDVTGLLDVHPAGPRSILRKAGGADCTKDMKFHSKAARKMLEKCFIGKLEPCGEDPESAGGDGAACAIM